MAIDKEMLDAVGTVVQGALEPLREELQVVQGALEPLRGELQQVRQDVRSIVKEELQPVNERLSGVEGKLVAVQTAIMEIQHKNRDSHLYFVNRLDHIQEDIRRLSPQKEKIVGY